MSELTAKENIKTADTVKRISHSGNGSIDYFNDSLYLPHSGRGERRICTSGRHYDLSGSSVSAIALRMCGRSNRRWSGRPSDSTCMGSCNHNHQNADLSSKGTKLVTKRNVVALLLAFAISATGYYIAEGIMFGFTASFFTSVSGSIVQSGGSAIMFVIIGTALDKIGFKTNIAK